jgi:uncharacterized cupin superfamily protein
MKRTLLLISVLALVASLAEAQEKPGIIQFNPNGPNGAGLTGPNSRTSDKNGSVTTYTYYRSDLFKKESAGVWEANGFKLPLQKVSNSEFIHLLRGTITLADKNGQELVFKAGDSLLIPRGTEVAWKNTENLKEYWVVFDADSDPAAPDSSKEPRVTRMEVDGPPGKGLSGKGKTRAYEYYSGPNQASAGVWETDPSTGANFHTPAYSEFMYFLKGTVTLSSPDGTSKTFHAGDAALVPRGVAYKWSSDTVRKFWVIFDHQAVPAASTTSSK